MKYMTSLEAATILGRTKRYINSLCNDHKMPGAYKQGNRWMIPEESVYEKVGNKVGSAGKNRSFNTTGVCLPNEHYMVDLDQRLAQVKKLVDDGKYFTINRARQFGKTTTLQALYDYLNHDYFVVSMDFQMQMSDAKFKNENSFSIAFAKAFTNSFRVNPESKKKVNQDAITEFQEAYKEDGDQFELVELFQAISTLCNKVSKPMVLMIDEVDSATNNQVFLDFLAQLRGYYINRNRFATFQTVILAGVYDIKNLKRKMRSEDEHKDNSPWNIAADFDIDMSFSALQIAAMLKDYEADHKTGMNLSDMAQEIYDYTDGYPYLVSRLCQILDKMESDAKGHTAWSHEGFLDAVNTLVYETNALFDDIAKKLKDYPVLENILHEILFCGKSIPFNLATELVSIGFMFGFLKNEDGQVAVANRIFEIWLYNLFIAEEALESRTYHAGQDGKIQFIKGDELDMKRILTKFVEHFIDVYGKDTDAFIEENGRKLFLLYIRPLINGTGHYYIESRTRSMGRTDLIIDYKGKQYVIEMKIWHGDEYNSRGEQQLISYLEDYNLERGYMLSFNFNKNKTVGVMERHFKKHTLVEAVV